MKIRIYIKKYKKQKLLDTNCWLLRIGNKNCFELKIIIKKLLVLVAYFTLFLVTSFISHSWLKVTFHVLFICIFYWCFNHTPWSGCLDVVWWVISLPLPGGLYLWWTSHSLGVWCFLWHWCALFPFFRKNLCFRWSRGVSRNWLDVKPVAEKLSSACVVIYGVWSVSVPWGDRPTWSGLLFLRFLHKHDCLMLLQSWWFTSILSFICSFCVLHTSIACLDAVGAVEHAEWYWG